MKRAVLLLAHGAPERLEDVESYLSYVRGGRPGNPKVLEEVRHRYAAIGGSSPLLSWTRAQAEALECLLGLPVFFGMRNWHPFIRETMGRIRESGVERLAGICLAPQFSELSIGLYIRRTEEARREAGVAAEICWAKSFHTEPLLIEAFAERLRPLAGPSGRPGPREIANQEEGVAAAGQPLDSKLASEVARKFGASTAAVPKVLFTAHSLPEKALANGDPYAAECRATAAAVASSLGLADFDLAFQSQGMTDDRWLGPTVESTLDRYAADGLREVALDPIGFVCDHVEILFDIDRLFREYAAARGITLRRPESLNDSPTFTAALAEVAKRCL
ncbi:MAG: ferrochelatase [Bryobacteraceae bacterium]